MFKFYLTDIEDTLHALFNRGMRISGVFDSSHAFREESVYPRMKGIASTGAWNPSADVFFDPIDGLLHHKYCIIDADAEEGNKITVTGSFNWDPVTNAGNDENSLVIFSPRINNLFYQEFMARYKESGGVLLGGNLGSEPPDAGSGVMNLRCFPNPFRDKTTIEFMLDQPEKVTLEIFNNLGRLLYQSNVQIMEPGLQHIPIQAPFEVSTLPEGLLVFRLWTGSVTRTLRVIHHSSNH